MSSEHIEMEKTRSIRLSLNRACIEEFRRRSNKGIVLDGKEELKGIENLTSIPKADERFPQVSAAGIVAKHYTNTLMKKYCLEYPGYNFSQHKGYGTPEHREKIKKYGKTPYHRKNIDSFLPNGSDRYLKVPLPTEIMFEEVRIELRKAMSYKGKLFDDYAKGFIIRTKNIPYNSHTEKMLRIYFDVIKKARKNNTPIRDIYNEMLYEEINTSVKKLIEMYNKNNIVLDEVEKSFIKKIVKAKNDKKVIEMDQIEGLREIHKRKTNVSEIMRIS